MAHHSKNAVSLAACVIAIGCSQHPRAASTPDAGAPFPVEPPAVYVAKVKNILVGLPPTNDEVQAVAADPTALGSLVDQWMARPEYQEKMLAFFELALQQTQINTSDFTDMIPPQGLGVAKQIPLLLQNLRESFARTVLAINAAGRPLTDAFTTRQLMMTPALIELYAFLDTRHVDDSARVSDLFAIDNPTLPLVLEAAAGPIAIADTLNPQSPSYMHWYNPDIGKLPGDIDPACNVDPIVLPADAYGLHLVLYGSIYNHSTPAKVFCATQSGTGAGTQMAASDFTTWKLVTIRAPRVGEPITAFYDLPSIRSTTELVLKTPRIGFFSTPAFGANWPTNQSNQMRVTLNQTLIVATGMAVDGTDATSPPTTPGLDAAHAAPGSGCFGCHQLLDPTRSILASTFSWYYYPQTDPALTRQKGLFAFQGVITPVHTIDDFANALAEHPAVPAAWAQKLCYWMSSAACASDDPELQRVVGVFQRSGLSWNALVRELATSPLTTNQAPTKTTSSNGEVIAVTRRDHLCAALDHRLGLVDVCGLDAATGPSQSPVPRIVSGLPSDGYGRGSPIPVLPNQPTLFYRAGLENICASVAALVIDRKPSPSMPNSKKWSSAQPDAAIADFVATLMALTSSDPRAAPATSLLRAHFQAALHSGATPTDALTSTFVAACLSPSFAGIGM
jgi:hypothetical protein